jgi:hypothetical protein
MTRFDFTTLPINKFIKLDINNNMIVSITKFKIIIDKINEQLNKNTTITKIIVRYNSNCIIFDKYIMPILLIDIVDNMYIKTLSKYQMYTLSNHLKPINIDVNKHIDDYLNNSLKMQYLEYSKYLLQNGS